MEFSRQECESGLLFPSPGDLTNPGIESGSPGLQADSLPSEPPGNPKSYIYHLGLHLWVHSRSLQSCPTFHNHMYCSLPGSSVHGILQAKILAWVAMPSSRGSSQPRGWTYGFWAPVLQANSLLLSHWGRPSTWITIIFPCNAFNCSHTCKSQILELWTWTTLQPFSLSSSSGVPSDNWRVIVHLTSPC